MRYSGMRILRTGGSCMNPSAGQIIRTPEKSLVRWCLILIPMIAWSCPRLYVPEKKHLSFSTFSPEHQWLRKLCRKTGRLASRLQFPPRSIVLVTLLISHVQREASEQQTGSHKNQSEGHFSIWAFLHAIYIIGNGIVHRIFGQWNFHLCRNTGPYPARWSHLLLSKWQRKCSRCFWSI